MKKEKLLYLMAGLLISGCTHKTQPSTAAQPLKTGKKGQTASTAQKPEIETPGPSKEGITIQKASACRSIEDRNPVGESEKFPADVGRIYLFTQIQTSTSDETSIQHIWSHEGKTVGTVTLPVRGTRWRTYSSKIVDPTWKGSWKVDVATKSGAVIQTVSFKVD